MLTEHSIFIGSSHHMASTEDNSIDLVVTSPPYPMIEMWDECFSSQNCSIVEALKTNPDAAFDMMHRQLDEVWGECYRVMKEGGFLCINIGDATRTINGKFKLYNNHARISAFCNSLGFTALPNIIWHKQTNSPNKFMGSGMLPCGAYVTLEHEWILIFRKGGKRIYKTEEAKLERMKSSFFWEERNQWFSDIWDVKGTKQNLGKSNTRERSAAFPFEIPFRLINMFSQKGDIVLDPFIGTGTTMQAAILTGRNSYGYEIDAEFEGVIREGIFKLTPEYCNTLIQKRFDEHNEFIKNRKSQGKEIKHFNKLMNCEVMTTQEEKITLNRILDIRTENETGKYIVEYEDVSISSKNNN